MSIHKFARHGALALTLAIGSYITANFNDVMAGEAPPPSIPIQVYSEQGFDFTLFNLDTGTPLFELSGPGGVFGVFPGSDGMLGVCVSCVDGEVIGSGSNVISITRQDEALFSMTGFVGGSFPDFEGGPAGPEPAGSPGVDFVVALDPFTTPFAGGLLIPGLDSYAVSTPLVSELLIFSPAPFDNFPFEDTDCLCFDSISFDVAFGQIEEQFGPQTAQIGTPITVTFSSSVPEPAAWSLFGIGLAAIALARRRQRVLAS